MVRSIKSSSNAEKITHTLNDKQRIINWFNNDLICAQTLKDYPMTGQEKTEGKTLYARATTTQQEVELKIKNSQGNVLETLDSTSSSSIEKIDIRQTTENENVFELLFYEKSLDSENPLYERKPQEADQIIVACDSTTTAGYVLDRCGSSCLCPDGQEIFKGNCTPKCNEEQVRQANGECTCLRGLEKEGNQCQCPEGRVRQDDGTCGCHETQIIEDGKCVCLGELVFDKIKNICRKGKDCPREWLGPVGLDIVDNNFTPHSRVDKYYYKPLGIFQSICTYRRKGDFHYSRGNHGESGIWLCTTIQGYNNGFKEERTWYLQEVWEFYCYDGQIEILQDPHKPGGSCTIEGFLKNHRYHSHWNNYPARRDISSSTALKKGDVMYVEDELTTSRSDSTRCYRSR